MLCEIGQASIKTSAGSRAQEDDLSSADVLRVSSQRQRANLSTKGCGQGRVGLSMGHTQATLSGKCDFQLRAGKMAESVKCSLGKPKDLSSSPALL